jgi:FkbM family methyltransferase
MMRGMESDPQAAQRQSGTLLWRFGLGVREGEEWRRDSGWSPENLRKPGFAPATIVDVGVGRGTPLLYEAFPEAYLVLIEPLREFEPDLERIVAERPGEYVLTAVGVHEGTVEMKVDTEHPWMSSIMTRVDGPGRRLEEREVPITTIDTLLEQRGWEPPFALKVDTEGFEHHVLQGSKRLLEDTQFVIAEVSVGRRLKGGYGFGDFIRLMESSGFSFWDILDAQKSAVAGVVQYFDALFRRDPRHRRT